MAKIPQLHALRVVSAFNKVVPSLQAQIAEIIETGRPVSLQDVGIIEITSHIQVGADLYDIVVSINADVDEDAREGWDIVE